MSHPSVANKHILITGGASGIGAATAKLLASRDAKISIADLNADAAQALVAAINEAGGQAQALTVDVSSADSVAAMHQQAIANFGPLDVAINNAGIDHTPGPLHELGDAVWDKVIAVNLTGVWYCTKGQIQAMLGRGGHIINIASVAGVHSAPLAAPYAASKHGVVGLTKTAAVEYAKANIRFNAVCPSFVRTPMVERMLASVGDKMAERLTKANPMRRLGEVDEVAGLLAWLCTDESSFMTGHNVVLDGGMTA